MSCNTVHKKLSAYLDGEMSGTEMQSIRSHIHNCRTCQTELDSLKSVQMVLRGLPASPEPSLSLQTTIAQNLVAEKRSYLRLGLLIAVPTIALAVFIYHRPTSNRVQDRDLVIHRQLAKDQIFDAGTDSTSGASLVHYTNYEGH